MAAGASVVPSEKFCLEGQPRRKLYLARRVVGAADRGSGRHAGFARASVGISKALVVEDVEGIHVDAQGNGFLDGEDLEQRCIDSPVPRTIQNRVSKRIRDIDGGL